jgi:hypothetical protein
VIRLFERQPGHDASIYAEAQALADDGLDLDFVLDLFPDDAEWLAPLLQTSGAVQQAAGAEQPSYFFEASLKQKFLAAAAERPPVALPATPTLAPASPFAGLRTAFAGTAVVGMAAAIGVVTLGFVTADTAVPGDWNYAFKLANERLDYTLSRGDQRINVQLRQTEARVREIQILSSSGNVSSGDLEKLQHEAEALKQLAQGNQLDEIQKGRVKGIGEASVAVLSDVKQKNASLEPAIETTITTVNEAVAAVAGTVKPLDTPPPSATPTTSPTASTTPVATSTPVTSPTASATANATTPATETATPPPHTATPPTSTPPPSETASASPTGTTTPAASETPTPGESPTPGTGH